MPIKTWHSYTTKVYRYRNSLEHLFKELCDAGVPSEAYITFSQAGADYELTAIWTEGER